MLSHFQQFIESIDKIRYDSASQTTYFIVHLSESESSTDRLQISPSDHERFTLESLKHFFSEVLASKDALISWVENPGERRVTIGMPFQERVLFQNQYRERLSESTHIRDRLLNGFFYKSIRLDSMNFWKAFIDSSVTHTHKGSLRKGPRGKYIIASDEAGHATVMSITDKKRLHEESVAAGQREDMSEWSKPQSLSYAFQRTDACSFPSIFKFPHAEQSSKSVGVILHPSAVLPVYMTLWDGGTVGRPTEFDRLEEAYEYLSHEKNKKFFVNWKEFEAALQKASSDKLVVRDLPFYPEILGRVHWRVENNCCGIFVQDVYPRILLIANELARLIKKALLQKGAVTDAYEVPIFQYHPDTQTFALIHQLDVLCAEAMVKEWYYRDSKWAEELLEHNYEILLATTQEELPFLLAASLRVDDHVNHVIWEMLANGYVYMAHSLLDKAGLTLMDLVERFSLGLPVLDGRLAWKIFIQVARAGYDNLLSDLLKLGFVYSEFANRANTPLIQAAIHGHEEIIKRLLNHFKELGCLNDPNVQCHIKSALYHAIKSIQVNGVEILIKHIPDWDSGIRPLVNSNEVCIKKPSECITIDYMTLLGFAVYQRNEAIIHLLIDHHFTHGAHRIQKRQINFFGYKKTLKETRTPISTADAFHAAALTGQARVLDLLFRRVFDPAEHADMNWNQLLTDVLASQDYETLQVFLGYHHLGGGLLHYMQLHHFVAACEQDALFIKLFTALHPTQDEFDPAMSMAVILLSSSAQVNSKKSLGSLKKIIGKAHEIACPTLTFSEFIQEIHHRVLTLEKTLTKTLADPIRQWIETFLETEIRCLMDDDSDHGHLFQHHFDRM